MSLWAASTDALLSAMNDATIRRASVITNDGTVVASHAALGSIADAIGEDTRDYHGHRAVFLAVGEESGHLLSAFVHKTVRGQAAGGVRFWGYATVEEMMRDGLRLSRGMGHKNALAGLWWGGGKGVIARRAGIDHRDAEIRAAVYRDYGRFISGLCGCYVTAEDAGTTPPDMARVFEATRYTTCIPAEVGGSGNPSVLTARGVVAAMEAALEAGGLGTLEGKVIASEGLGNVARHMIGYLLERGVAQVHGADIDEAAVEEARRMHPDERLHVRHVAADDSSVLATPCDVVAPNAVGATLNPRTIPLLRARIVCGAANNQLEEPARDAAAIAARDIVYVPDFLANRMGIVSCANEQYGVFDGDPAIMRHLDRDSPTGIHRRTLDVLERSRLSGRTPAEEAERLAETLSDEPHPIWGDRGGQIIDALVREGWADAGSNKR